MRVMQGYDSPGVGICYNFQRKSSHLKNKLQMKKYEKNSWWTHGSCRIHNEIKIAQKLFFKYNACWGVSVGVEK